MCATGSEVTGKDVTGSHVNGSHVNGSDVSHVNGSDVKTGIDVIFPRFFLPRVVVEKANNTMTKRYQRNNQKP